MLNIAMLVGGYGVGQGSIFLAQTWLVAQGKLELLALFGTHFAFAMFGIIAVDAGSLTLLARHAASMEKGAESVPAMWRHFWEMSVFRGAMAALVIAPALGFGLLLSSSPFSYSYVLFALPGLLFWVVNAAGFLDGLRLSGISGISGSIAYAASALALVFVQDANPALAGAVLGAAFSGGYLLTVIIQFVALRVAGWPLRFERPTRRGIAYAGRDGLVLLGGSLPGQAYFRVQLLIGSVWLGPAPTALFLYVKQIVTAVTQMIGFVRRVEFPTLVQKLARGEGSPIAITWNAQIRGTQLAFASTLLLVVGGLAMTMSLDPMLTELGGYLAVFALGVTTSAVYLTFSQGLWALGNYSAVAYQALIAVAIGIAISFPLVHLFGVAGLAIADILSGIICIAISAWILGRHKELRP